MWRNLVLIISVLLASRCRASSRARDSLRDQVAMLRREQWRDRERIEALERRVLARGERDSPSSLRDEGLLDMVEELSREIGELADELRLRQGLEGVVESLQERQEQVADAMRQLTQQVKDIQAAQGNIQQLISLPIQIAKKVAAPVSTIDPFSEEGSGDLAVDSLFPAVKVRKLEDPTSEITPETENCTELLEKQQRCAGKLCENIFSNVHKQVELIENHVAVVEDKMSHLLNNVTSDVQSSIVTIENLQGSVKSLWKRVTQVEFNSAQSQAVLDVLEHDWIEDNKRIKVLQNETNLIRREYKEHSNRLLALEALTTNVTLQRCRTDSDVLRRNLQLQNLELRLSQTNQRMDEWTKRSENGRRLDDSVLRNYRDALANVARRTDNVSVEIASLQDTHSNLRLHLNMFIQQLPTDCSKQTESGTTLIRIPPLRPVLVYCDILLDGESWLVIQRRINGSMSFFRDWREYRNGFGEPNSEFWIGNEILHLLTISGGKKLHIDMWDVLGGYWYADYRIFRIRPEEEQYALEIANHSGNASDALGHHFGMGFSTHDRDNDASSANCAVHHTGGWWYQHCHKADLNGRYSLGMTWYDDIRHEWLQLKHVEMKIASNKPYL